MAICDSDKVRYGVGTWFIIQLPVWLLKCFVPTALFVVHRAFCPGLKSVVKKLSEPDGSDVELTGVRGVGKWLWSENSEAGAV